MIAVVVLGVTVLGGTVWAGRAGHRLALAGEFPAARRAVGRRAMTTGVVAAAGFWVTLGWPWKLEAVTVWEAVVRPVDEVVDEAFEEAVVTTTDPPWWQFWRGRAETSEVVVGHRPVSRTRQEQVDVARVMEVGVFSPVLLIVQAVVAGAAHRVVFRLVRLLWRFRG